MLTSWMELTGEAPLIGQPAGLDSIVERGVRISVNPGIDTQERVRPRLLDEAGWLGYKIRLMLPTIRTVCEGKSLPEEFGYPGARSGLARVGQGEREAGAPDRADGSLMRAGNDLGNGGD